MELLHKYSDTCVHIYNVSQLLCLSVVDILFSFFNVRDGGKEIELCKFVPMFISPFLLHLSLSIWTPDIDDTANTVP